MSGATFLWIVGPSLNRVAVRRRVDRPERRSRRRKQFLRFGSDVIDERLAWRRYVLVARRELVMPVKANILRVRVSRQFVTRDRFVLQEDRFSGRGMTSHDPADGDIWGDLLSSRGHRSGERGV